MEKYWIEPVTFFPHKILNDFNTCFLQHLYTFSWHFRIRISGTDHHSLDLLLNDRLCTWRSFAIMTARFQCDINGRTFRRFRKWSDRITFCMKLSAFFVIAFSDNPPVFYDHCPYHRIRICPALSLFRQLNSLEHIILICHLCSFFPNLFLLWDRIDFKSNARETWCVILVSESWHILLRITAHSTLRSGRHKTIVHWTMCALAERLSQSEIVLPLRQICYSPFIEMGVFSD